MSNGPESSLPQWATVFVAAVTGLLVGTGTMLKLAFSFNSRLQEVESKAESETVKAIVRKELERERHDVLYPMLQVRVYGALDKMEEEMKVQGQNIAILLERDRAAAAMERFAESVARVIGEAVTNALKDRP